jgi:hypothetical protein
LHTCNPPDTLSRDDRIVQETDMATIQRFVLTGAILALAVLSGMAQAQERHGHGGPGRPGPAPRAP